MLFRVDFRDFEAPAQARAQAGPPGPQKNKKKFFWVLYTAPGPVVVAATRGVSGSPLPPWVSGARVPARVYSKLTWRHRQTHRQTDTQTRGDLYAGAPSGGPPKSGVSPGRGPATGGGPPVGGRLKMEGIFWHFGAFPYVRRAWAMSYVLCPMSYVRPMSLHFLAILGPFWGIFGPF